MVWDVGVPGLFCGVGSWGVGNMLLPHGVEQDPNIRFAIMTSPCEARG